MDENGGDSAIGSRDQSSPTPSSHSDYNETHPIVKANRDLRRRANETSPALINPPQTKQTNSSSNHELLAPGEVASNINDTCAISISPSKYDNIPMEPIGSRGDDHDVSSYYFEDGVKRIDFILVYNRNGGPKEKLHAEYRENFENNLREEGLKLEYTEDDQKLSSLSYVKIHAPWDVLCRYAEIMKLKMPMKHVESTWKIIFDEDDPYCKKRFTAPYTRDKEYLFNIPPVKERFFSSSQRSQMVDFILKRKSFSPKTNDASAFGLNKLLQEDVYLAAYPLHEGKITDDKQIRSPRMNLVRNWANLKRMFRKQPLNEIRAYFGVKIALYFAWLGFYTSMLIPASIVGVICFIYGLITLKNDIPSAQICDGVFDHTPMCPLCTMKDCRFWNISTSCAYARITYLFDNPATVFFAVFMSLWATVYLEMWKRYAARITYRWDLSTFDSFEEYPRPEYLAKLSTAEKKRLNAVTRMYEPYVPFWRKQLPYSIFSGSMVLLLILVAFACVLGVIVYRVTVRAALAANQDQTVIKYSSIITAITAAMLNLVCIMILNFVYGRLAFRLTELEMPRTQTDFDNSLTLKMYLLQFVNYYSSIFYIAFFKGRFVTYPGDLSDNNSFASRTTEECGTGGCFVELAIQLSIIMVGKQALNAIMEMSSPWFEWCRNRWTLRKEDDTEILHAPQWEADFLLASWKPQALFYEYLEMVLQFGFVTIFVAAFPLAPIFALINNAFEIRLDARKMIISMRRPVAQRVKDIGIWYRILDAIGKLAVLSNALLIAFTSSFLPKLYHYAKHGSLQTYLNSSFSLFESDKFKKFKIPIPQSQICMYQGHRLPPDAGDKRYEPTQEYWEELAVKLAFIVVFENVIAITTMILRWAIPDIPKSLKLQMRQHEHLTSELIMQQELKRAKEMNSENN
ncbi:Anoctamin-1-like protein [Dinothrombium tinctorium]|uniref:Anoctamin n=1 Tax=Dinothrombium tinctorium TaxID=1965070 RepID=A0A3S3NNR9_9ACAR|nr:Anoctamin-1-like protein [Dinothrombium tinctorium]RWS06867.1 Anoctamin-1-like protein [Dinothrombium tinctorium]RWS06870.1 Anoctamin-1-like protein [Dinothrombium tinctorium]